MTDSNQPTTNGEDSGNSALLKILQMTQAKREISGLSEDFGLAEILPFPFFALVGQKEMRLALLLSVINPAIGGVLLIGTRGIGKTTAVRSLSGILPDIQVSACISGEGCLPEDAPDNLCPNCLEKWQRGDSLTRTDSVKLIELPLNARIEDVVGGVNERVAIQQSRVKLERGILARADQNLLYIDEVNLLENQIADAILDAAAAGQYTVRRGPMVGTYRSRFVLIGSMNPEEGALRPQIMDRFGLRVMVRGLTTREDRLEVYQRVRAYRSNPRAFIREWLELTLAARDEVSAARALLPEVNLAPDALDLGLRLIEKLDVDSHRAEYAMFEAARAHAAADGRTDATVNDVKAVAAMALRQRRSQFMVDYIGQQATEDEQINEVMNEAKRPRRRSKRAADPARPAE
jgi:magnesium chelatase subunit I